MRTALVTASYLDGADKQGNDRYARNLRYLTYYTDLQKDLGFEKIFFIDNASSMAVVDSLTAKFPLLQVIRYPDHLAGGRFAQDYLYCWRALYTIPSIMRMGYDRLYCIDSDCFILSGRFARWTAAQTSGWNTVWCPRWGFPEASFAVICHDQLHALEEFCKPPMEARNGALLERIIPFTHIDHGFNCDRYGEIDAPQADDMDLYCQANLTQPLTFRRHL